jgi:hypothetical protein
MAKAHSFDIDHAKEYGVEEAIAIHSLQWWIEKNRADGKFRHEERWWVRLGARASGELFPYWSQRQIERVFRSLLDQGVTRAAAIAEEEFNGTAYDRTLWYAFEHEERFLAPFPQTRKSAYGDALIRSRERVNQISPLGVCNKVVPDSGNSKDPPTPQQAEAPEPGVRVSSPNPEPPATMPDGTPRLTRQQADALETAASKACNALTANPETLRQYRELFAAGLTVPLFEEIVQETLDRGGPKKETLAYFLKACRRAVEEGRRPKRAEPRPFVESTPENTPGMMTREEWDEVYRRNGWRKSEGHPPGGRFGYAVY